MVVKDILKICMWFFDNDDHSFAKIMTILIKIVLNVAMNT
jgi:hypothetical protein